MLGSASVARVDACDALTFRGGNERVRACSPVARTARVPSEIAKAQIDQGAQPQGARALLVGAGAAGSAIAIALLEAGVCELVVCDSDPSRGARLIELQASFGRGRTKLGGADPTGATRSATPARWAWRSAIHCQWPRTG